MSLLRVVVEIKGAFMQCFYGVAR